MRLKAPLRAGSKDTMQRGHRSAQVARKHHGWCSRGTLRGSGGCKPMQAARWSQGHGPRVPGAPHTRLRRFFFIQRAMKNSGNFTQRKDVDSESFQKGNFLATWRANPQALNPYR